MDAQRFDDPAHHNKIERLEAQDYAPNNYPTRTSLHMRRHNLELVEDGEGKVQGTLGTEEICMICEEEGSEEKELFSCDGQISGEMEDGRLMPLGDRPFRACNSKFHLECIMAYNAGNYDFHYAARPECQRKFLCPLHCCSVCNIEHKKQSAYEAQLIECAYCFRAFHSKCCYPAGSETVEVTMDFEKPATFQMLICPTHCPSAPALHHIPACCKPDCKKDGKLQSCRSCIRSFHPSCREVKQLNEASAPRDQCDACASEGVIVSIYQFMELDEEKGFRLDMANYGNIARYANNSCNNPNAMMYKKHVFAEERKGILYYENRCFLEAKKSIKKDAEVTITYGDKNNGSPCFCDSCKPPVDPVELQWDKNAKDD
ncbi:hypothetical protein CAEBREN_17528 [Caenorhabditis brenneri]|uniref:SET domain-containing protein n=1 Tax=Caenorhabditis brenneri TaxID=135651 RepID=G0NFW9_CAEBE|nr:hypothetical protein CAEBREN_17528 [Caenorhabditis brenneri]